MSHAFSAPHRIAKATGEYVVQIIDEFQYFNKFIYDNNREQYDLAGIYMSLAESKVAPVIAKLSENDPYYISAIIMSRFKGKDLTTDSGMIHSDRR